VSLLLRNELCLELGAQTSRARIWRAGWPASCVADVRDSADATQVLERLLAHLVKDGHDLPARARIVVADELLHYAVLAARGSWRQGQQAARDHFANLLGPDPWLVTSRLMPGGTHWLAVASEQSLVANWQQGLADVDVRLLSVRAALPEDLWSLRRQLPWSGGVLAVLREQGLMLAGFDNGSLCSASWERCDMAQPGGWIARIEAFSERLALNCGHAGLAVANTVRVHTSVAALRELLAAASVPQGWELLTASNTRAVGAQP
jgi:hypothetical protein